MLRQHTKIMSDKIKAKYDKAMNSVGLREGGWVLLYNPQRKKGLSPKLQGSCEGSYQVIKRLKSHRDR